MSRAILRGYYGLQNAGDDAFVVVSAWAAAKRCHCTDVVVAASRVPALEGVPLRALYPSRPFRGSYAWGRLRDAWVSRGARWVILGGGSNFHSSESVAEYAHALDLAPRATAFAAGVSVGPFRDEDAAPACARLLNRLAFTGVRDLQSLERARQLAPKAAVELTFDIAVLLPRVTGVAVPEPDSETRRGLGVSLCNFERFHRGDLAQEYRRLEVLAEALREAARRGLLEEVVLLDFNSHPIYGDHALHRDLAHRIEDRVAVRHVPYAEDPAALLERVSRLRGILAMRLHAAVFAYSVRTPTLILAYHEKNREWARMVELPPPLVLEAAAPRRDALVEGIGHILSPNAPRAALCPDTAMERAMRNWTWVPS